jgi:hypothetical protein
LKAHLDSLSPEELRSVRPDYYWLRFGQKAWLEGGARKANFNPEQPRVPAGNPGGGQWTSGGGNQATDFSAVRRGTRVSIDYSKALTGISTIDNTTKALSETLARTMERVDFIPEWTPQAYGTAVHVAFGTAVRFQGLPGIGPNDVEHSFGGDYGEPGSIRTDVVLRNEAGDIIAIYDVKTGGARLSAARDQELREKTGVGANVPIIEMSVLRGATLKGHIAKSIIGVVQAQLWASARYQ